MTANALQAMRSRRAIEDEPDPGPATLPSPIGAPLAEPAPVGAPPDERSAPIVPDVLDVLQTIDGPRAARRTGTVGRRLVAVAAAVLIFAAAVLVVVSSGRDAPAPSAAVTVPRPSTNTVESARLAQVTAMKAAADRGDYNAAIAAADELRDPAAARYRGEAAAVLVRRAGQAAKRGDLALARQRLRAAKRRYDTAPGGSAVEAQIKRIQRARAERARAERAAKRRAAERRRTATAAANTQNRTPAPTQTSGQAGTPTPTQGTPQRSTGSESSSGKKSDCSNGCGLGMFP